MVAWKLLRTLRERLLGCEKHEAMTRALGLNYVLTRERASEEDSDDNGVDGAFAVEMVCSR